MDGYPQGAPLVEFAMADLVTVKPPGPPAAKPSPAPEPHSLFCTVSTPPSTASRCELHRAAPPGWRSDAPAATAAGAAAAPGASGKLTAPPPGPRAPPAPPRGPPPV